MNFSLVCRTCMGSDTLKPIFTNKNDFKRNYKKIFIATGIKIHYNDELPQNMCKICSYKINETHKFRQQCKEVETKLLKFIEKENQINIVRCKKKLKTNKIIGNRKKYTKKISVKSYTNEFDDTRSIISDYDAINTEINSKDAKLHTGMDDESKKDDLVSNYDNIFEPNAELTTILLINRNNDGVKIVKNSDDGMNTGAVSNDGIIIDTASDDEKPLNSLFSYKKSNHNSIEVNDINLNYENSDYNTLDCKKIDKERKTELKIKSIEQSNIRTNNNDIDFKPLLKSDVHELPYDLIKDLNSGKTTKVFCKICCKELSIRSIASHMAKRHPGADSRKIKCELCDSYVMADKLNRHNIMMHDINGYFMCRYCKVKFEMKGKLVEHVKECTDKKRKRKINDSGRELLKCDICNKVMQKASLRMHNAMKHAGLKPVCQHCGISFGNKLRLQEHYRAKHGYEKFKCKYCEFTSAAVMAMRNHERRHIGDKPYICETCGVKFHAAYLLTQHRQSHRTDRVVKCDLCPAAFKANNSLHMHKLTCHSNTSYMCTLCCRSYKCRHYALKHIRHVHRYNGNAPPLTVVNKEDVVTVTKN